MEIENSEFGLSQEKTLEENTRNKEELVIEQDRVLVFSGLGCPFKCKYCFTEHLAPCRSEKKDYLPENQIAKLKELPSSVNAIMLGCDTEFFQNRNNALDILKKLSPLGKDLSVVTKSVLPVDYIAKLVEVNKNLGARNNLLAFSMSLPCIDSVGTYEPISPNPRKRIKTLKNAHDLGLKTFVAIRPLLPSINKTELQKIIDLTKNYCYGYYSGPLYLKGIDDPVLNGVDRDELITEEVQPPWMPERNIFYKIAKTGQMESLRKIVNEAGKELFEGAAEAIKYLKK